jgi:ECF sigma factor
MPVKKNGPRGTSPVADVTQLLVAWGAGDESACEAPAPLVYGELKRFTRRSMGDERVDHTLQATALVNEAYLRLVDIHQVQWQNRPHFLRCRHD